MACVIRKGVHVACSRHGISREGVSRGPGLYKCYQESLAKECEWAGSKVPLAKN